MRSFEIAPLESPPDEADAGDFLETPEPDDAPAALLADCGDEGDFDDEPEDGPLGAPFARVAPGDRWFEEAEGGPDPGLDDEDGDRFDDDEPEMALIQELGIELSDGETPLELLRPLPAEPEDVDDELAA